MSALLLAGGAWAAGELALEATRRRLAGRSDPAREFAMATVAGFTLLGLAFLSLALAGWMDPRLWWAVVLVPIGLRALRGRRTPRVRARRRPVCGGFEAAMLALAAACALVNLAGSLLPPHDYNTLNYQLQAPREFLAAGRMAFLPHNYYASLPALVNMHYLWGLVVGAGADGIPHLINWTFGLLTALATYAYGRRLVGRRASIFAACLFYATAWNESLARSALVDAGVALFALVSVAELEIAARTGDRRAVLRSAIAGGAALATKYQAVVVLAIPLGLACWLAPGHTAPRSRARATLLWMCTASLVLAPWLVRSWAWTANPVYPFLDGMFHSPHWDGARASAYLAEHAASFALEGERGFRAWLPSLLPLGSTLVWALPLCALMRRRLRPLAFYLLWAAIAIAAWLATMIPVWRYVFPVAPALCLAVGAMLAAVGRNRPVRWATRATALALAVIMVLTGGLIASVRGTINSWTWLTGQVRREHFVRQRFPAIGWMNENLPGGARVLYLGEDRPYHARHTVVYETGFANGAVSELLAARDARQLLTAIRALGVTHIHVNERHWDWLSSRFFYLGGARRDALHELLAKYTREIVRFDSATGCVHEIVAP